MIEQLMLWWLLAISFFWFILLGGLAYVVIKVLVWWARAIYKALTEDEESSIVAS